MNSQDYKARPPFCAGGGLPIIIYVQTLVSVHQRIIIMHGRLLLFLLSVVVPATTLAGLDEGITAFENEDYQVALAELQPLAKSGKVTAMTWLGKVYADGLEQPALALPWFLDAAQKGDAEAQFRLGELYAEGLGVEQDEEQALVWYEKAARQDDNEAQLVMGIHEQEVLGDNPAARDWYEKSAGQGNAEAQYRLGLLLLGEPGISRQPARAWMFLSLAAEEEVEDAASDRDVLELGMKAPELAQGRQMLQEWQQRHQ